MQSRPEISRRHSERFLGVDPEATSATGGVSWEALTLTLALMASTRLQHMSSFVVTGSADIWAVPRQSTSQCPRFTGNRFSHLI